MARAGFRGLAGRSAGPVFASPPPAATRPAEEERMVKIYRIDPEMRVLLEIMIKQISPPVAFNYQSPELLIVTGTPGQHKEVEKLLSEAMQEWSRAKPKPTDSVIRIVQARIPIDDAVESAVKLVLGRDGSLAVDSARKMLILKGSPEKINDVEQLLEALESRSPAEKAADQQVRVRVVWLVGNQDGSALKTADATELPPPPEDLTPVLEQLNAIGVRGLRLVANLVISTSGDKSN